MSDYAGSAKEELDKRQLIVKPDGNLETDLVCCYSEQILHCWCRIIVLQDKWYDELQRLRLGIWSKYF